MQIKPLDPSFTIQQQLAHELGPVVLVNLFTLAPDDEQAFLDAWSADAAYMKARPGFISAQLHRAVGDSPAYLNTATWESVKLFRDAFSDPAFREGLKQYPASATTSPHLFERVAVPGICTA